MLGRWVAAAAILCLLPAASSAETYARKPAAAAVAKPPSIESDEGDVRYYRYRLNTYLGFHLSQTSAVAIGAQFGLPIRKGHTIFVGPEVSFSLFSSGNILMTLASAWHEMRVYGSPRLNLAVGLLAGTAFCSNIPNIGGVTYAVFGDAVIAQDIDDLVTIRGQFRPGIIGGYFAFMMNFNVSFRFL
jgi:hypothetical protein